MSRARRRLSPSAAASAAAVGAAAGAVDAVDAVAAVAASLGAGGTASTSGAASASGSGGTAFAGSTPTMGSSETERTSATRIPSPTFIAAGADGAGLGTVSHGGETGTGAEASAELASSVCDGSGGGCVMRKCSRFAHSLTRWSSRSAIWKS